MSTKQENPRPSHRDPVGGAARKLDLKALREKLATERGPAYWRSLEELAGTPEFQESIQREFPAGASEWWDGVSRRNFLKLAAASMALAGLTACTKQPTREIFPYVNQPAELVLGEPLFYATSMLLGGYATGVLVKSREGHPVKVDGNPEHPASLGGSNIWLQASVLDLYDPDRSQSVVHNGDISTWAAFLSDLNQLISEQHSKQGSGLRFLTETITSPTLAAQLGEIQRQFPNAKWHQYDAITRDNVREGSQLAFGRIAETQHRFDSASIILSIESDFLYTHPDRLRYVRQFTDARRVSAGRKDINRLYAVESSPSLTGSMADHRLALSSGQIEGLMRLVCKRLGLSLEQSTEPLPASSQAWVEMVVSDLEAHHGATAIIAGECQPPIVHALVHWMNEHLGNVGKTVSYTESAEAQPINQLQSLRELCNDMRSGKVDALFILGNNPVYTAPSDLGFEEALRQVKRSIYLGLELDETVSEVTWHIPGTHFLESWGDARSFDGTISLAQPLIAPLYDGKSAYELLGALLQQQPLLSDYEIVHDFWRKQSKWPEFEAGWREALHNGFIASTASSPIQVQVQDFDKSLKALEKDKPVAGIQGGTPSGAAIGSNDSPERAQGKSVPEASGLEFESRTTNSEVAVLKETGLEVCFRPDPSVWDGRFANNGWLQECPRPLSKLTWDNAALISPGLAGRSGLATGDVVELAVAGRSLRIPVWILPGQADKTVTLTLGYGRRRVGRVGTGVGFNTYVIRTSGSPWVLSGAQLLSTRARHMLVSTQTHHGLDSAERQVFRACRWDDFKNDPQLVKNSVTQPPPDETLYYQDEYPYTGYKWGMSIDLTTCIGCNACLVACQTENNIPFVGKDQVSRNREMFWIRVDTYYRGSLDNPTFAHMPVPCMHCEHAPCELVCPVEATVHDHEGLNLQVYNRCVGTRFCSNNCPYKVRRFNFYQYTQYHQANYRPMYNPEVTVRWRGVMEKCTYCIQRISAARITAEKQNRRISENEIKTACQQACPAKAIVFGDLNSTNSQVADLKRSPLDYSMLGQLNTRPRTTYLAKMDNPNAKPGTV